MLMLAQLVIDYREMWKLTSLSSSAGVLLPLALRSTVWICCTGMHRSVAGSYTTAAHSRSDSEEGLFSESNYFKSQKSEWWRVFGIFRSVADQEWAARLKHSAKKNWGLIRRVGLLTYHPGSSASWPLAPWFGEWFWSLLESPDRDLSVDWLHSVEEEVPDPVALIGCWAVRVGPDPHLSVCCLKSWSRWSPGSPGRWHILGWLFDSNSMKIVLNV